MEFHSHYKATATLSVREYIINVPFGESLAGLDFRDDYLELHIYDEGNRLIQSVYKGLDYKIDGDFIESQAFAFLAIRTIKNLPISFPNTTGCKKPCVGGKIIEN